MRIGRIEQGIKLPKAHPSKYPFIDMIIGSSIFIEIQAGDSPYVYNTVKRAYMHVQERLGYKFRVRREGNGFRIWRIE